MTTSFPRPYKGVFPVAPTVFDADGQIAERGVHAVDLTGHLDPVTRGQLRLVFRHYLVDVGGDRA